MVNNRINGQSKNKEVFDKSKPIYNQISRDSGFANIKFDFGLLSTK